MGTEQRGAIGIGYAGKSLEQLLTELTELEVTALVDVRLNAISRKRGLSKRALGDALNDAGITYLHRPELGNPRHNRAGFAETPRTEAGRAARAEYAAHIATQAGRAAIDDLVELAKSQRIALLCFEASDLHCHRQETLAAIRARLEQVTDA